MTWRGVWLLLASASRPLSAFECQHCDVGEGFDDVLAPQAPSTSGEPYSDVHVLWPTHIEVIPLTKDLGGWLPASFHKRLAKAAVRGWARFRDEILPRLPPQHPVSKQLRQGHAGALNDAFFHYQKRLFEVQGDENKALYPSEDPGPPPTPPPDANTSWPDMDGLPEYRKLRKIVDRLSRRYLVRSGMSEMAARALNYSIFNWAAVHGAGEYHGPHTHVGEYHVGVFYAQAGETAGKLRFGDPRGQSAPFGREFIHSPKSGHLVFFPSWLSHMVTSSKIPAGVDPESRWAKRVVFSFNIGPVQGPLPCHLWFSDPTGNMRFQRRLPLDPEKFDL